jgi:hypothetical protein
MQDIMQFKKKLETPEIRVWVHPPEGGDDYVQTFDSFKEAIKFTKTNKGAESVPLIAFRGFELNLFEGADKTLRTTDKPKRGRK